MSDMIPEKIINPDREEAIINLGADATEEEIGSEINRISHLRDSTVWENLAYQRQREKEYPSIKEQLDMLYWDRKNRTNNWEELIDKIKADNPKP